MSIRSINRNMSSKINEWLESIPDKTHADLKEAIRSDVIVTGGAIASLLLKESIKDYDIYFATRTTARRVSQYYLNKFAKNPSPKFRNGQSLDMYIDDKATDRVKTVIRSAGIASEEDGEVGYAYFEDPGLPDSSSEEYISDVFHVLQAKDDKDKKKQKEPYRLVFLSSNAITLSDDVQLVMRFQGAPDVIHLNYDFTHCTNYWTFKTGTVLNTNALTALLTKELKYIGSRYPVASIVRMRKFIKRGWWISAGHILKMVFQVNELDLNDLEVLEEQLTGVDTAYFIELITILKQKKKDGVDIDRSYIANLILE